MYPKKTSIRGGEIQKEKEEEIQKGESKEGYMALGDYVLFFQKLFS